MFKIILNIIKFSRKTFTSSIASYMPKYSQISNSL